MSARSFMCVCFGLAALAVACNTAFDDEADAGPVEYKTIYVNGGDDALYQTEDGLMMHADWEKLLADLNTRISEAAAQGWEVAHIIHRDISDYNWARVYEGGWGVGVSFTRGYFVLLRRRR